MNRLLRALIMASTLILFFMPLVRQTHAGNMRSPCILTALEKALVNELTRFYESSYLATQANIKKCVILGVATILIYYENGHIGLFGADVSDVSHDRYVKNKDAGDIFYEFINIWYGSGQPDMLSPKDLAHADTLVLKFLSVMSDRDQPTVASLGSKGNRYLTLIERHGALSTGTLLAFYGFYLDISDMNFSARTQDIPTDQERQIVIKKVIKILETGTPAKQDFSLVSISRHIKTLDPDSYKRLLASGLIVESDE